jgi:glucose uptake protein
MRKPLHGAPVAYRDYIARGTVPLHLVGVIGCVIWNTGMAVNIIASAQAGPALSYGLGQGATMIGAIWGVFVWKEFSGTPRGTGRIVAAVSCAICSDSVSWSHLSSDPSA